MPQEQSFHLPLRASQIDQYDQTCKHLFSQKVILAYILRDYVPGFENCSIQQMMNDYLHDPMEADPFTNALTGMTNDRGHLRYDLLFSVKIPGGQKMYLNVEPQGLIKKNEAIMKRVLYYSSEMISSQYGTVFTGSHYEYLRRCCGIWIVFKAPKKHQNRVYQLKVQGDAMLETQFGKEISELCESVVICLGEPDEAPKGSSLRLLDILFSRTMCAKEKEMRVFKEYGITLEREEGSDMPTFGEAMMEVMEYEAKQKYLAIGKDEGKKEGRIEGLIEGRIEGQIAGREEEKVNGILKMAEVLRSLNLSQTEIIEKIQKSYSMSYDEIHMIIS